MLVPWYLVAFEIIGKSGSVCNHSVFKAILVHQDVHKAWWSRSAVWLDGVSLSITSSLIDKLNVVVSAGRWTLHLCRNITRLQAAESSSLMLLRVNKVSGSLPPCDLWLKLVALAMRMRNAQPLLVAARTCNRSVTRKTSQIFSAARSLHPLLTPVLVGWFGFSDVLHSCYSPLTYKPPNVSPLKCFNGMLSG